MNLGSCNDFKVGGQGARAKSGAGMARLGISGGGRELGH